MTITAYLKPTNYCNVNCSHCYLPQSVRANKDKMSDDTLNLVTQTLIDMSKAQREDSIFLIWHGGEPLVLPIDYYHNAGKIIDTALSHINVIEAIQTSLIPFTEKHIDIVHSRWRSEIGSSIDFSARTIKGSNEAYQDLWLKKVELARNNDIFVIPTITPNKQDTKNAKFIFNWLKDNDFWYWSLDRYSNFNGTLPDYPCNTEHAQFLIDLYDLCFENFKKEQKTPYISTIAAAIGGVLFGNPGDRWGGSCQSDFITFNPDGSLNNCPDKDSFEKSYGSLSAGFKSFQKSENRIKWIKVQKVSHVNNHCSTCVDFSWCKSGCPINNNSLTFNGKPDDCSGFSSFLKHIRKHINQDPKHKDYAIQYLKKELYNV